MSVIDTL